MMPQIVPAQREQHMRTMMARGRIEAASVDPNDVLRRKVKTLDIANVSLRYSLGVADKRLNELQQQLASEKAATAALQWRLNDLEGKQSELGRIVWIIAETFSVSVHEILSHRRHGETTRARMAFYWLAKTFTRLSYPDIGRYCGRDHTSVLNGARRVQAVVDGLGPAPSNDPASWAKHLHEGWTR